MRGTERGAGMSLYSRNLLTAPVVVAAERDVLPAELVVRPVMIRIEPREGVSLGDRCTLLWAGGEEAPHGYQDFVRVRRIPFHFQVPAEFVAPHLGTVITVEYRVDRPEWQSGFESKVRELRVGTPAEGTRLRWTFRHVASIAAMSPA